MRVWLFLEKGTQARQGDARVNSGEMGDNAAEKQCRKKHSKSRVHRDGAGKLKEKKDR